MTVDEFETEGVRQMDDDEMTSFLSSQHVGVLALPTDGAPAVRPLSFWFDGDERVYLRYVGSGGQKTALSDRADVARFLVYRAETRYNWRSVILTGTIDEVPESEAAAVAETMDLGQPPDALERASESVETTLYRFVVTEWTGVSHIGLPPEFETDTEE
ncbi:MAG: pyridoxamine 5'-phosphate oxidase family protein [Haloferacaceae archaeon]